MGGAPQKEIAQTIRVQGTDEIPAVKGNQSSRQTAVPDPFKRARAVAAIPRGPTGIRTVDGDHGRTER